MIAPMVFTGSLNAEGFEGWLALYLLPSLIRVEEAGHQVVFLPKYSPDLNDIEHDFSALKRARMYAPPGTSLDEIIRAYCAS